MVAIGIIGSTGKLGYYVVKNALDRGYECVLLVRPSSTIKLVNEIITNSHVKVVETNFRTERDVSIISESIKGLDAIVSVAGPAPGQKSQVSDTYELVNKACKDAGVKRIIVLGTLSITSPEDSFSLFWYIMTCLVSLLVNSVYKDIVKIGQVYENDQDLDWTIVRVTTLHNSIAKNGMVAGYQGKLESGVGLFGSRPSLADFFLDQVDNKEWIHKLPLVVDR